MDKPQSLIHVEQRLMTEFESKCFMVLNLAEIQNKDLGEEMKDTFLYKVLEKRLEYFQIPVTRQLIAFIVCIIDSPGKAVQWAYTLNEMYKKLNHEITFEDFIYNGFGNGIPTEEGYRQNWESQKIGGSNALDMEENWK